MLTAPLRRQGFRLPGPRQLAAFVLVALMPVVLAAAGLLAGPLGGSSLTSVARAGVMAALPPCTVEPFTDVPISHPQCPEITWLKDEGITAGYPDGTYLPDSPTTRMATAAFLSRLADAVLVACATPPFTDVGIGHTFCPEIEWMKDTGITNGYGDGTYRPSMATTRMAFAAFLARVAGASLVACSSAPFTDVPTGHAFCPEITWVKDNGISNGNGDGTFGPSTNVTRAEAAALLYAVSALLVNDPPVAVDQGPVAVDEDDDVTITLTGTDDDNDDLTFSIVNGPTKGSLGAISAPDCSAVNSCTATVEYTTTADLNGADSFTFKVNDGDVDSADGTVSIDITPINDGPTNTVPASTSTDEDTTLDFAGGDAVSVADVDSDAGELEIDLSVTNGTLTMTTLTGLTFSTGDGTGDAAMTFTGTLPDINNALATLTFDPTPNFPGAAASGIAAFSITSDDQGNTGGGALTDTDGFDITVNQVNDAPDPADHTLTTSSSIRIAIGGADSGKLKDGATDPEDAAGDLTVSGTFTNVDAGANVSLTNAATGTYTYNPAAGFTGVDTFNYQVCDDGSPFAPVLCGTGSVTVTVNGVDLWFVDDSASPGGTGRLTDPFDSMADLPGGRGTGDRIFVYTGGMYTTGHTLLQSEHLVGQASTGSTFDTLMGVVTPVNGTLDARPGVGGGPVTLTNTVTLATNSKVQGIDVNSGINTALAGSGGLTGVQVSQTNLTTSAGTALSFNNVAGTVNLGTVSKSAAGTAINLTNVAANVAITGGTIQNTTTGAILIDGGAGNFSYGGSLANISTGREVTVQNKTVGAVISFTGAIGTTGAPLGGSGIFLDNNDQAGGSGGSVTFSGGVNLSTGASVAFTALNGGTVNVTGTNTLTTTTAAALVVTNTTIGASGITFQSINVDGNDAAPANGVLLTATGSTAGLTVTGTGSAGTGGTIQDTSGNGIELIGTRSPSFSWMTVTSNLGNGIHGGDGTAPGVVTNGSLSNVIVSNNGNNSGTEDGILFEGLVGTATWSNLDVSGSSRHNAAVINNTGTLTSLTISGSNFHDNSITGSNGFEAIADGTAVMTVNIGTTNFTKNHTNGVLGQTLTGGTLTLTVTGGSYANNFIGVEFTHASTGNLTGSLTGANITNTSQCTNGAQDCGAPVNIFLSNQASSNASSVLRATVTGNTIDNDGSENAPGVWVHTGTPVRGHIRAVISNNNISDVANRGIDVGGGGCTGVQICDATIDATIENNTISLVAAAALEGIGLSGATNTSDTMNFCVDIENNNSTSTTDGIRVRHRQNSIVRMPGYGGTIYDTAAVITYLDGRNVSTTDTISATSSGTGPGFVSGACSTPT